jgi:hypothetical protein
MFNSHCVFHFLISLPSLLIPLLLFVYFLISYLDYVLHSVCLICYKNSVRNLAFGFFERKFLTL